MSNHGEEHAVGVERPCRCEHTLGHYCVRPSYSFGPLGILGLVLGFRAAPRRVQYTCGFCGEVVKEITGPKVLRLFKDGEASIDVVRKAS